MNFSACLINLSRSLGRWDNRYVSSPLAALLLSSSPWLLGASLTLIIASRLGVSGPFLGISTATGGLSGYMLIGLLPHSVFVQTLVTGDTLWAHILLIFAGISAIRLVAQVAIENRGKYTAPVALNTHITGFAALLAVIAIYGTGIWQALWLPTHGWDVLDHWAPTALNLMSSSADTLNPDITTHYHPIAISKISTWSSSASLIYGASLPHTPWMLTWISIGMIVYFFARYHRLSHSASLLSCYFTATIPLLENHTLIAGYGEIFVGAAMISACALLSLGFDRRNMLLLFIGLAVAAFPIGLKNTGAFYTAAPLFGALFLLHHRPRTILLCCIFTFFTLSALFFYHFGIDTKFFGNPIYHQPSTGYISIFGKALWFFTAPPFTDIFFNHIISWFVNGSFGQWFLVVLIALLLQLALRVSDNIFSFLAATVTFGIVGLAASQLTVYGYSHGVPANDIGHSRFTLPLLLIVPLLCLRLLSLTRSQEAKP